MILFHKNFKVNPNDINFKQSRQCSKDFTFVPIQYNQKDFIIQTPHCFIPFGLKKYSTTSTKTYLDITFQEKHEELIQDCFSVFYQINHLTKVFYTDKIQLMSSCHNYS